MNVYVIVSLKSVTNAESYNGVMYWLLDKMLK